MNREKNPWKRKRWTDQKGDKMKAIPNVEVKQLKLKQLEKELELENLWKERSASFKTEFEDDLVIVIKSVKTFYMPVPNRYELFHLFVQSLEKVFKVKNVFEELKSEILLNILGEKANNLIVYISEEDLKNYDN
ncbi:uncharacterized protein CEXT_608321 [Caerostris extrusa]|uniref:Uncharacterized protein n=1 Tax=Caerostris extrusa TaxID=172846 RepID=A0AAV4T9N8_CAEEX|nr:uncharacterized protein CEXT_608321 [Caerostris extrusa]